MLAAGLAPKLRSFTPALVAYAEAGAADKAFEGERVGGRVGGDQVGEWRAAPAEHAVDPVPALH